MTILQFLMPSCKVTLLRQYYWPLLHPRRISHVTGEPKVPIIENLAKTDIESCAAFAVGDASTVENNIQRHLDDQSVRRAADSEAALFDAAAAAHIRPQARRVLEAHDIQIFRSIASSLGDTSEEVDMMLSRIPDNQRERCRIGVLFFQAIAATPDDTAAKFAFH